MRTRAKDRADGERATRAAIQHTYRPSYAERSTATTGTEALPNGGGAGSDRPLSGIPPVARAGQPCISDQSNYAGVWGGSAQCGGSFGGVWGGSAQHVVQVRGASIFLSQSTHGV